MCQEAPHENLEDPSAKNVVKAWPQHAADITWQMGRRRTNGRNV
jgi:hypothetical protein